MVKAISEYIPEQGTSMEKFVGFPAEVSSEIIGAPYEDDSVIGRPAVFHYRVGSLGVEVCQGAANCVDNCVW